MLYDPKWEKKVETKADPFSLRTLIAWLEQQNLSESYRYTNIDDCPLARYFRAQGYRRVFCGPKTFNYGSWWTLWAPLRTAPIPSEFNDAVIRARTYEDVLENARASLTSTDGTKS